MDKQKPFFSVCIPNYNYAHYIEETVDSVLSQDFSDFEIIIVDNASTDNSWEVLQKLKQRDSRISIFRNKFNIGFAPNLQAASEEASGHYINLLSADDKMAPGALSEYARLLDKYKEEEYLFIFSDTYHIDSEGNPFRVEYRNHHELFARYLEMEHYNTNPEALILNGLDVLKTSLPQLKNPAPFLSVVYSKSLWDAVGGYNAPRVIGPDKFFNYKALSLDPRVIYVRKPLFEYRVHTTANSMAQASNSKQQIDDYLNILDFRGIASKLDLAEETLISAYLNRVCYKSGIQALLEGNKSQSVRCRASMLQFPNEARKNIRYYLLYVLNIFYPLSRMILPTYNKLRA